MTDVVIIERRAFDGSALRSLCEVDSPLKVAAVATSPDADDVRRALSDPEGNTVVVIGRTLLREQGPELVARLRHVGAVRVLLAGIGDEAALKLDAVRVGADGFIRRDGEYASQLAAIRGQDGAVPRWEGNGGPSPTHG